jgi:hypothetical protein
LLAFGWSPVDVAWAVPVSSAIDVFMLSPLAVITAGHHMDHSGRPELQGKSGAREGSKMALVQRRCHQVSVNGRF